jgi:hypothetical protein
MPVIFFFLVATFALGPKLRLTQYAPATLVTVKNDLQPTSWI